MKKAISGVFVLLLAFMLCVPAFAEGNVSNTYGSDYDYSAPDSGGKQIVDDADLLTDSQEEQLLTEIESIRTDYSFDVVLHTTNSIGNKTIADYADDYYDYNGYGIGENRDGLLFMINMNNGEEGNRDFYTSTCGFGITAFPDSAIKDTDSAINAEILPYLRDGDWYGAFDKYLDLVDIFLARAENGESYGGDFNDGYYYGGSYDSDYSEEMTAEDYIGREVLLIIVAFIIAIVISLIVRSKMKTNVKRADAADYIVPGSLVITSSADVFSHVNVTKTARPKETSSSGSSVHTSSSGTSHGGGGGKF